MLHNVVALTTEYDMLPRGSAVICAVSGGSDSMCLLHYLASHAQEGGYVLHAAHYNHHLRGAESDRDAAFVESWCAEHGVPLTLGGGDVAAEARRRGLGVEETAREMRYAFLESVREECAAETIATAHNADDNAETLLLHLVRGSGLQGLTGIPPRRGNLVRPLLTTPRSEIEAYLKENSVPHVEDSTNTDTQYARNRIRREVMPILRDLNPRLTESLSAAVSLLRADNDYLNARAARGTLEARWAEDDLVIRAEHLARQSDPVATRMVRRMLTEMGDGSGKCTAAHLKSVVDLARGDDPSAVLFLPDGLMAQRIYEELLLTSKDYPPPPIPALAVDPDAPGTYVCGGWTVEMRPGICPAQPKKPDHFFLSREKITGALQIRARKTGDEITLPMRDTKSLKKLLIDGKIPRQSRNQIPVLADEEGPLAVAGFGPDMPHLAQSGEAALEVRMKEKERSDVHAG
ncbi:MAG: tRNA lysidine(34) synthetase TilS [Clostridia bacterium]|nr:tRNA lysidine(34) synthetase TilS [Clostridia bacterium]